jgi:hypothetical protein
VAALGLVLVIFALVCSGRLHPVPGAVGAYIGAAFFTSSTSFANPAISVEWMLSNTFAGIDPTSVLPQGGRRRITNNQEEPTLSNDETAGKSWFPAILLRSA